MFFALKDGWLDGWFSYLGGSVTLGQPDPEGFMFLCGGTGKNCEGWPVGWVRGEFRRWLQLFNTAIQFGTFQGQQ